MSLTTTDLQTLKDYTLKMAELTQTLFDLPTPTPESERQDIEKLKKLVTDLPLEMNAIMGYLCQFSVVSDEVVKIAQSYGYYKQIVAIKKQFAHENAKLISEIRRILPIVNSIATQEFNRRTGVV